MALRKPAGKEPGRTNAEVPGSLRRRADKMQGRQGEGPFKSSYYLSADAYRRLRNHAVGLGISQSAIVETLVNTHLRRFTLADRERSAGGDFAGRAGVEDPEGA